MGLIRIMKRGGEDYYDFKKALKMAKRSIETLCELTEDMEDKYSERDDDELEEERKMRRRGGGY